MSYEREQLLPVCSGEAIAITDEAAAPGEFLVDYVFRCTFCNKAITWLLKRSDLGLSAEDTPRTGKMYRYSQCYCGFGRFVICERAEVSLEEVEHHIHEHMEH